MNSPRSQSSPQLKKIFPSQRANEHVIMLLRRHWIIWFKSVLRLVVFNLPPIFLFIILFYILEWIPTISGPLYVLIVMVGSFYYLSIWLMYFHQFVDYRLDVWILTDQRIVSVEQQGLFDRVISEFNVIKVQDVTSEVHGHLQTFLDYGNVYIQTAGEQQRFVFQHVPHPEEIARLIVRANDAALKQQARQTQSHESNTHAE